MTPTEIRTAAGPTADTADPSCTCPGGCGSGTRPVTRRTAIGVGVIAGAALVTACGTDDTATSSTTITPGTSTSATPSNSGSGATTSSSNATTSSSSSGATTASDAATSQSPSSSGSSSAAPSGTEIAKLADVPSGGSLIVAAGSDQIALARNADGTVVAHSAICTHQGCTVNADGATLKCPCHGSTFDAFTGAVTKPPANAPLAAVTVEVSGDAVYLTA